jgi:hypothetical protein
MRIDANVESATAHDKKAPPALPPAALLLPGSDCV